MIGNDIIDRSLAQKHIRSQSSRYWQKVLNKEELIWLKKQPDTVLAFHMLWATKEASYKVIRKMGATRNFSPKSIIVNQLTNSIYYDSLYLNVQSSWGNIFALAKITEDSIEVYAAQDKSKLEAAIFCRIKLPGTTHSAQSHYTRKGLYRELRKLLALSTEKFYIQKENSIPKLYISGRKAPIDISLSHHGNWGAFGFAL